MNKEALLEYNEDDSKAAPNSECKCDDDGVDDKITHSPQCVTCKENEGGFRCAVLVEKPERFLMNEEVCPFRIEE